MTFFIFNYNLHSHYIDSFLSSSAISHNKSVQSKEWFNWKFRDNPFGEAILVCAEENGKIIGCVAYGVQPFWLNGKIIKGVLSFETFVHPSYQKKGVFSRLIELGEKELISKGIDLMINFPNSNSLNGFLKSGWKRMESPEYWIKFKNPIMCLLKLKDIRMGFKPNKPNFEIFTNVSDFTQIPDSNLCSVITLDYL